MSAPRKIPADPVMSDGYSKPEKENSLRIFFGCITNVLFFKFYLFCDCVGSPLSYEGLVFSCLTCFLSVASFVGI